MKLLDSTVLVDIDRGGIDRKVRVLDEEGRHAISMVSITELRLGVHLQYERGTRAHREAMVGIERLLARFEIVPISRRVATAAADIIATLKEDGAPLHDLHDVYIAATARTEQLPVLTGNVSHFERIDDLRVVDWSSF